MSFMLKNWECFFFLNSLLFTAINLFQSQIFDSPLVHFIYLIFQIQNGEPQYKWVLE